MSLRFFVACLSLCLSFAFWLTASNAQAGSYKITYSGGQSVSVGVNVPGGTYTQPYSGTYGGGGSTSWGSPGNSVTCSGGITATVTWQPSGPGDNPPATAIVVETDTASWSGTGVIVPSGHCKDGLNDPEIDTTVSPPHPGPPTTVSGISQGVHYWVKSNPGQSFQLTPSPLATVSCAVTQGGGNASVSYTASVTPVIIDPVGATSDGSGGWDVLVGQEVSPALIGIPASCTVSNYNSAVSGITMQSWTVSADQSHTTEVDGSGPLNIQDPIWFWNDPSKTSETITCTSATVTPPVGQGTAFTITAAQNVGVYLPSWTATGYGGEMLVDKVSPDGTGNGTDYWLHADIIPGSGQDNGMTWRATLAPPVGAPVNLGTGNIYLVQVITPSEGYTNKSHQKFQDPDYGQTGLDSLWPYPWFVYESPDQPYYLSSDGPGIDLTSLQAIFGSVPDSFVDYIMYQPPSPTEYSSPQYVPLGNFKWSTNGTATLPGTNTWANYPNPAGSVTPSGSAVPFTHSNKYPSWAQNDNAPGWTSVP